MMPDALPTTAPECPFLVPVMADRLWRDRTSVYCRRPDGRVRVPSPTTVACICATHAHLVCPDYLGDARLERRADAGGVPAAW